MAKYKCTDYNLLVDSLICIPILYIHIYMYMISRSMYVGLKKFRYKKKKGSKVVSSVHLNMALNSLVSNWYQLSLIKFRYHNKTEYCKILNFSLTLCSFWSLSVIFLGLRVWQLKKKVALKRPWCSFLSTFLDYDIFSFVVYKFNVPLEIYLRSWIYLELPCELWCGSHYS